MALEKQFSEVIALIKQSRLAAFNAVNVELINLYWIVGEYVSNRIEAEEWGKSVVQKLALYIERVEPEIKGFSDKNLWRMKQFYEGYKNHANLSAVLREISWTNNLVILSRAKSIEERESFICEFVLKKGIVQESWNGKLIAAYLNGL